MMKNLLWRQLFCSFPLLNSLTTSIESTSQSESAECKRNAAAQSNLDCTSNFSNKAQVAIRFRTKTVSWPISLSNIERQSKDIERHHESRLESKIESFYTRYESSWKLTDSVPMSTVSEAMRCYYHFCSCQETRWSLSDQDNERVNKTNLMKRIMGSEWC